MPRCRVTDIQVYSDFADEIAKALGLDLNTRKHVMLATKLRAFVKAQIPEVEPRPDLAYIIENQGNCPGRVMAVAANQVLADQLVAMTHDESGWVARKIVYDDTPMGRFLADNPDFRK